MVKNSRNSKDRKSKCHRRSKSAKPSHTRKMRGGGAGSGWTLGSSVGGVALGSQVNQQYDACLSSARPGQMAFSQAGGLPGMKGGAYTNNLTSPIAGFAQIDRDTSHCNPNHVNLMNTGMIKQSGGAAVGPGGGSIAASASPILEEHTARYTTAPSQWTGSTGAPVLLNQPLNGQMWSKACTQTGGKRKNKNKNKNKNKSKKNKSKNKSRN
uniref:Uncharacterized protein n=1 Tax=viral metagenome TaxID=1070528 RepID=A0A6C0K7X5_9ZZZZ